MDSSDKETKKPIPSRRSTVDSPDEERNIPTPAPRRTVQNFDVRNAGIGEITVADRVVSTNIVNNYFQSAGSSPYSSLRRGSSLLSLEQGTFHIKPTITVHESNPINVESRILRGVLQSDIAGNQDIALKILSDDENSRKEAAMHFRIPTHPNIVHPIFANTFKYLGQPCIYIALELCDPLNLYNFVKLLKVGQRPFPAHLFLSHVQQITEGVAFLHSHGIINRDLKPQNILLTVDKTVAKICDFGLSKPIKGDVTKLSKAGAGTSGWMSPEVLRGDENISTSADLFSLGLIHYFLLSYGDHAFGNSQVSRDHFILHNQNQCLENIQLLNPGPVSDLISRMLHPDATLRPTAAQVKTELKQMFSFLAEENIEELRSSQPSNNSDEVVEDQFHGADCEFQRPQDSSQSDGQRLGQRSMEDQLPIIPSQAAAHASAELEFSATSPKTISDQSTTEEKLPVAPLQEEFSNLSQATISSNDYQCDKPVTEDERLSQVSDTATSSTMNPSPNNGQHPVQLSTENPLQSIPLRVSDAHPATGAEPIVTFPEIIPDQSLPGEKSPIAQLEIEDLDLSRATISSNDNPFDKATTGDKQPSQVSDTASASKPITSVNRLQTGNNRPSTISGELTMRFQAEVPSVSDVVRPLPTSVQVSNFQLTNSSRVGNQPSYHSSTELLPTSANEGSERWIKIEGTSLMYNANNCLREGSHVFQAKKEGAVKKEDIVIKFVTECVKDYKREVQHLIDVGTSEYVVKYIESGRCEFHYKKAIYIAMERCETKTLADRIGENISYEERKNHVRRIAKGLRHLKKNKIIHRDLKPQNILFRNGSAVVSDFGLSKKHPEDKSNNVDSKENVGTNGWRAPETADTGGKLSYETDIFAAGLVFSFVLTNGKHPYGPNKMHRQTDIDRDKDETKCNLQDVYKTPDGAIAFDLIKSMLSRDPKKRPSIEEVLKHPFFFSTDERLKFLSTAHETMEFMKNLQKAVKTGYTPLDLNSLKDEMYGKEIEKETENWDGEKLLLTPAEIKEIESNFKQKGESIKVNKDAMVKKRAKKVDGPIVDLLRLIRNRDAHHLEDKAEKHIDMTKEQFLKFFSDRFPHLFIYLFCKFKRYYHEKNEGDKDFSASMAKYFME